MILVDKFEMDLLYIFPMVYIHILKDQIHYSKFKLQLKLHIKNSITELSKIKDTLIY